MINTDVITQCFNGVEPHTTSLSYPEKLTDKERKNLEKLGKGQLTATALQSLLDANNEDEVVQSKRGKQK